MILPHYPKYSMLHSTSREPPVSLHWRKNDLPFDHNIETSAALTSDLLRDSQDYRLNLEMNSVLYFVINNEYICGCLRLDRNSRVKTPDVSTNP